MVTKYDPEEILRLYQELGTQSAVARHLGIRQSRVSESLRRQGIHIGRYSTQKFDPVEVLRLWQQTGNQHEVARILGMYPSNVSRILIRQGIRVGKGRLPVHQLPMDEVAQRYLAGETSKQIADDFGIDAEVVRRRLARSGVHRPRVGVSGETHPNWKGGRSAVEWYRRQSYEVAAICLGRPVPKGWIIHHVDENPENNDPPNLVLFRTQSEHFRFHWLLSKLQRANPEVDANQLALENGALPLPSPPAPILFELDRDWLAPSGTTG